MINAINVNGETYTLNHNLLDSLPDSTTKFLPAVTSDNAGCLLKVGSTGEWEITPFSDMCSIVTRVSPDGDILVKKGEDSILFQFGSKLVDSPAYDESPITFNSDSYYLTEIHLPSVTLLGSLTEEIYNIFRIQIDGYDACMRGIRILDIPNCVGVTNEFYSYYMEDWFTIIETVSVSSAFTHSNSSKDFFFQFIPIIIMKSKIVKK